MNFCCFMEYWQYLNICNVKIHTFAQIFACGDLNEPMGDRALEAPPKVANLKADTIADLMAVLDLNPRVENQQLT